MEHKEMKDYLFFWIQEHVEEIYHLSDFMWENPELGLEEYEASARIKEILEANGYQVESNIGGLPTAFVASYGTRGMVAGINVEYDCLPGLSQRGDRSTQCPVRTGAPGQGCGHNILGPAAVLAGIALKAVVEKYHLPVTIKLFGCPYEESSVGKPVMGKAGAFAGVDFFLDWHPMDYNRADYDSCNSVFISKYTFKGKTCHGASPWEGRSALDAGMLFAHGIEMLREHIIPGSVEAAHTINYTFTDTGPSFANIIPDTTSIILYGRFHELKIAQDVHRRVGLCAKGAAIATETEMEEQLITFTHPKIPNKTLATVVHRNMEEIGVPQYTEEEQSFVKEMQRNSGLPEDGLEQKIEEFRYRESIITDASEFTWNAPYATFELAMAPKGGWHNWRVTACAGNSIGKKCLKKAAEILAASTIDISMEPDVLKQAKTEWKERLAGRTYKSLIPDDYIPPLGSNRGVMEQYFPERRNRNYH